MQAKMIADNDRALGTAVAFQVYCGEDLQMHKSNYHSTVWESESTEDYTWGETTPSIAKAAADTNV